MFENLKRRSFKILKDIWHKNNDFEIPIIIFQPGKVGSLSIQHSLEEAYQQLNMPVVVHHVHALNHLDEREEYVKRTRKNPADSIRLIQGWRTLRTQIESDPGKKWNIINLVRDPVAIKVSALFQLLDQHIPDWQSRLGADQMSMSEIEQLFFSKEEFGFRGLDRWYDNQIKAMWGLDVFEEDFPCEKGYKIYKTKNINLLIVRLEDLNNVARQAFDDFLGLKEFKVINVNIGDEKPYARLYDEFKKRPLPGDYLDRGYQTRFAKHFYRTDEIEVFRKRWLQQV